MSKFVEAILAAHGQAIIAEYKRASPSLGDINLAVTVEEAVQKYQQNGATCLSILTEPIKFKGDIDFIRRAKAVCSLPILRKDFITTSQQVCDTKAAGADAMLLIVAQLSNQQLMDLNALALELGLDTLVEAHSLVELQQAIACRPSLVGVNSRNLNTLKIDLTLFDQLIKHIPDQVIAIAESGITNEQQLQHVRELGFAGALIGTYFMKQL
ncbi:MAG: indole-3-glycerol-phosphate synthase [Candidatus Kerfeldbacteria bacterium]|nr:indole-3-glycerol-phosphate synthase [Candidatus Kerfeldbacteria bacterium]